MKIIFDRSAFHRERFGLLKDSHLLRLVQESKILVFHTATFIDETLRTADSRKPGAQDEINRLWPFLTSICNGGWFKPLLFGNPPAWKSVCDEVLDGGVRDHDWPLVPSSWRTNVEAKVTRFLEGSGPLPELISTRRIYDQIEQIKKENKALRVELRENPTGTKNETLLEYYQSVVLDAAYLLIHRPAELPIKLPPLDSPQTKFDAWKKDPSKFPHFTAFVGFLIYSLYDAEKNQNSPLDRNWQGDAEQLCFLVDVDLIISSESRFMKRAFEALWQPSDKRMLTPEEFVDELSGIQ